MHAMVRTSRTVFVGQQTILCVTCSCGLVMNCAPHVASQRRLRHNDDNARLDDHDAKFFTDAMGVYKLLTGPDPRTVYDLQRARSETDHDAAQLQTTCIDQQLQNYIGTGRVIL